MPGPIKFLKQAQKMQQEIIRVQAELKNKEVETSAGGGVVKVKANGEGKIISITIQPDAIDPNDVEMLEDMVLSAVNQAIEEAAALSSAEMSKI
ncbi:MAG: YbaB/EbfC family nucleoid-associated protein, partial [Thermoplasmata archaeon]|nr:YbaB/EbfC family nucleoid-associated protein [Thermoplasmata archaeon]